MYEIELKAHVDDRTAVTAMLNIFATYLGFVDRKDNYWTLNTIESHHITARIRTETRSINSDKRNTNILFTYKRKELIRKDGAPCEVNDEKECILSDPVPLEAMLTDAGFTLSLRKHKMVDDWEYETPVGKATLELCEVPPLGDFLEIEILSQSAENSHVAAIRKQLESLLERCNIPTSKIEPRYYRDMLNRADLTTIKHSNKL